MNSIADHLAGANETPGSSQTSSRPLSKPSPKKLKRSWIEALWTKLHAIYGAKWSDSYPSEIADAAKGEWAVALGALSGEQIKTGLERCAKLLRWPPTPAEFIAEAEAGAPEPQELERALQYMPKRPEPKVLGKAAHDANEHFKKTGKSGLRRCVFSQHYGPAEYQRDLARAREVGNSLYDVDMNAKGRNGWTEDDEKQWRLSMMNLGYSNRMYPKGHEPQ